MLFRSLVPAATGLSDGSLILSPRERGKSKTPPPAAA
jgi:hypothetical protein